MLLRAMKFRAFVQASSDKNLFVAARSCRSERFGSDLPILTEINEFESWCPCTTFLFQRSNDAIRREVDQLLAAEGPRIDVICALRLLIAPLVESIILRDREAYLNESGCRTALVPLFDPSLSPRNVAVVACKL